MYKKKIIYGVFFLSSVLLLFNAPIFAQVDSWKESLAKEGITEEGFSEITVYYYKNPQPEKLISVIKGSLSQEEFLADKIHFRPFAHFIATVAHNDPAFLEKLEETKEGLPQPQKDILGQIISEAKSFESSSPNSPFDLDCLWVEFIATGDAKPVRKIISVLDYTQPEKEELTDMDLNTSLLIYSAQWSLGSNAEQHEKVNEILKDEFVYASGIRRERLEKILQTVNK